MAEEAPSPAAAPAEPPPAASPDPALAALESKLRTELTALFDQRVAGFQRSLSEKDREIQQLKTAALPPEQQEEQRDRESQDYITQLEQKVALAELQRQYPDVAEAYQKLMEAETPQQQAEFLRSLTQKAAEPVVTPPTPEAPGVDANNPAPGIEEPLRRLPDGTPISGESAWDFLKKMGAGVLGDR